MSRTGACAVVPSFDRLNYYFGQLLGHHHFLTEQAYFRDKLKLHNRCLHGYGVVCGLDVMSLAPAPGLQVACGLGLDLDGNELVVRDPIVIADVLALLSPAERAALPSATITPQPPGASVWLLLCYQERGIEPNRPVLPDACGAAGDCVYGKTREQVCVKATTTAPVADARCDCCDPPPDDTCLVLARIDNVYAGQTTIVPTAIHTDVRRPLGLHAPATVSIGIAAGEAVAVANVTALLSAGIVFTFSRPVQTSSLALPGLADVWIVSRQTGALLVLDGALVPGAQAPMPAPLNTTLTATFTRGAVPPLPALTTGDRVLVTLRTSFVLDACSESFGGASSRFETWFRVQ